MSRGRRKSTSVHGRSANKKGYRKGCSGNSLGRSARMKAWEEERFRRDEAIKKAKRRAAAKKAAATRKTNKEKAAKV